MFVYFLLLRQDHFVCSLDFGQIWLIRKNGGIDNGKIYAMKTIESDPTIEDQHKICLNELKVRCDRIFQSNKPFHFQKMIYTQTKRKLHLPWLSI